MKTTISVNMENSSAPGGSPPSASSPISARGGPIDRLMDTYRPSSAHTAPQQAAPPNPIDSPF